MNKNHYAHPIENTVIYRFNASLFFANSKLFQEDIENHLKEDTKTVIVDAGTITNIDITAADTLLMLKNNLEKKELLSISQNICRDLTHSFAIWEWDL